MTRFRVSGLLLLLCIVLAPGLVAASSCLKVVRHPIVAPPLVKMNRTTGAVRSFTGLSPAGLVINELDYDQPGADSAEFIEIKNPSTTTVNLDLLALNLVDGDGGGAVVYQTVDLPAVDLRPGDYYVVCADGNAVPHCDLEALTLIQNGAPDAVALVWGETVLDAVSYEGDTAAPYTESSGTVEDPGTTGNEAVGLSRSPDGADTDANSEDFGIRCVTPGGPNSSGTTPCSRPFGECGDPATLVHEIQGSGAGSPMEGSQGVVIEGVVVGDLQDPVAQLGGFFVQEEDAENDSSPLTSEGIFVYDNGRGVDVQRGDLVRVQGGVSEFSRLTELQDIEALAICGSGYTVTSAGPNLPLVSPGDFERYEGMLVAFSQELYATDTGDLGRFGEVWVSANERLFTPTGIQPPGTAANALQDLNDRNRLLVDGRQGQRHLDGGAVQNPDPVPYLAPDHTLRLGDTVENLTGVLSYGFDHYRLHPTEPVSFGRRNDRSPKPDGGGTLTVAGFNLANYFNGDGAGAFSAARGADSAVEFARQREKLIAAILALDADVVGVVEMENDGYGPDGAIHDLVDGLNAAAPAAFSFAFVDPSLPRLGADEITVGLLYRPAAVEPIGPAVPLNQGPFEDRNRQPLVQSFVERQSGERFTVAVNHFKSKGACEEATGSNADARDGQGCWNDLRREAAEYLGAWLATDPTGSGDPDVLVIGDLNAYALEDPIVALEDAGYTDLVETFADTDAYSYVFAGQAGTLDYALSNASLTPQVVGAEVWHINADEPRILDYNDDIQDPGEGMDTINPVYLYSPTAFRSSDHDPVLVYLQLASPKADLSISKTVQPAVDVPVYGTVTYTLVLANSGEQIARGAELVDVLPAEAKFAAWVISPTGTVVAGDAIRWGGDLGAQEVLTWSFTTHVSGTLGSEVVNTATLAYDGHQIADGARFRFEPKPVKDIVITEIMPDPQAVADSDGEWLELTNTGGEAADLKGCILRDGGTDRHLIDPPAPLLIQPGDYLVLARNGKATTNGGVDVGYVYANLTLANEKDEVVLECHGREVDRVNYDRAGFPSSSGASMQLVDPGGENNSGANWCTARRPWSGSSGDRGTPGDANDCLAGWPVLSIQKSVTAGRNPVHFGDALTYTIVLANRGDGAASGVVVADTLPVGIQGRELSWTGDVAAGEQVTLTLPGVLTTDAAFYGRRIVNTAFFGHESGHGSATAAFVVESAPPPPKLIVRKAVVPTENVSPGGTVTYTVSVANQGGRTAEDVLLVDALPLQTTLTGITSPQNTIVTGDVIKWRGAIGAGEANTWVFTAAVTGAYGSAVTNKAVMWHGGQRQEAKAAFRFQLEPIRGLVINEVDYDQPGADVAEFVELRNGGARTVDLERCRIALVNGSSGREYRTIALPVADLGPGGYYVVCGNASNVSGCDLDVSPSSGLIQNGAPDAVALLCDGLLIDAVSYEGDTGEFYTEGSGTGLEDDAGQDRMGISRCRDGADTNQNNRDLYLRAITPGEPNQCLVLSDLTITKKVIPVQDVPAGSIVTYMIAVANQGAQTAEGVLLSDALPRWATLQWISSPENTLVTDDVITWHGDVAASETLTWTSAAQVTGTYGATVVNTATLNWDGAQIQDGASFQFEPQPISGVIITEIMRDPQAVSDTLGEWFELYNSGGEPVNLQGCLIRDYGTDRQILGDNPSLVLGPGRYLVLGRSGDPARNGGAGVGYSYTGMSLGNGADEVILECHGRQVDEVDYDGGLTFPNQAGASMQLEDPLLDNNVGAHWCMANQAWPGSAGDRGTPGAANDCWRSVDLQISKAVDTVHRPVLLGDPITYTVVVSNAGEVDARSVVVTDTLPPGLVGDGLHWDGMVPAGAQVEFAIPAVVTAEVSLYGQSVTNTALFAHASGCGSASAAFDIESAPLPPVVTIRKAVDPSRDIVPGGTVTCTVVVSNSGGQAAHDTTVSDPLPLGMRLSAWLSAPDNTALEDDAITWRGDLDAGRVLTWTFTAWVTGTYGSTVINTATVEFAGGHRAASAAFQFGSEPLPALALTKTVTTARMPVHLGDPITYTVLIANWGDGDALGVVVTDTLPVGVIGSGLQWAGRVPAKHQVVFTLPATVTTSTGFLGQTITNTASYHHSSGSGADGAAFTVRRAWRLHVPLWCAGGSSFPPITTRISRDRAAGRRGR